jgi:hypothetical protein
MRKDVGVAIQWQAAGLQISNPIDQAPQTTRPELLLQLSQRNGDHVLAQTNKLVR